VKVGDSDALDDETIDAGQLAPLREFAPSTFSTRKTKYRTSKKKVYKLNFREQNMSPSRNGKDGSNTI
jgi:hypothetical protein